MRLVDTPTSAIAAAVVALSPVAAYAVASYALASSPVAVHPVDSHPVSSHPVDWHSTAFNPLDAKLHPHPSPAVPDRVVGEIAQHLGEPLLIAEHACRLDVGVDPHGLSRRRDRGGGGGP